MDYIAQTIKRGAFELFIACGLALGGLLMYLTLLAGLIHINGCATAPTAYRTATADEIAKYGVQADAIRYEYPDAQVFTSTKMTTHPDVAYDGRRTSISSDGSHTFEEGGIARSVETIKTCILDTDKCSVMVTKTIFVMRPKPVKVATIPDSEVTTSVQVTSDRRVVMLRPAETGLRNLVLTAIKLRDSPPHPGDDRKPASFTSDFIGDIHGPLEQRAAALLAEDGYVPITRVIQAEKTLADYESAMRGCINDLDQRTAAIADGERLLDQIFAPYVDPQSGLVIDLRL